MHGAYRANDPETSKEAAQFDVTRLEGEVYAILKTRPSTTEEIAAMMGRPLQSITPRIAPLRRKGYIFDTGVRRPGLAGRSRIVFAATTVITPEPIKSEKISAEHLAEMIKRHTRHGITDWVVDIHSLVRELEQMWRIK